MRLTQQQITNQAKEQFKEQIEANLNFLQEFSKFIPCKTSIGFVYNMGHIYHYKIAFHLNEKFATVQTIATGDLTKQLSFSDILNNAPNEEIRLMIEKTEALRILQSQLPTKTGKEKTIKI